LISNRLHSPGLDRLRLLRGRRCRQKDVDLFPRFNVMKHWSEVDHMAFESFVSPDGLHMNDWSYACMAKGLSLAIAEAAQRPVMSAKATSHMVP